MRQLKDHLDESRKENEALKVKIQQLQEKHGIDIDEPLNIDLERIMEDSTNKVHETGRVYNSLRSTLILPSERTLRDYIHTALSLRQDLMLSWTNS